MKIVDKSNELVPMGETGEIVIRSHFAFHGYLQEESKGLKMTKEGWVYTDDAGSLSPDGYVKVMGRKSDVISRGISLTYPGVVENMMLAFPGVEKVSLFYVL